MIFIIKGFYRSWVRQTLEEGRRTYRPKRSGNNNKDEDNSPKTLNDKDCMCFAYSDPQPSGYWLKSLFLSGHRSNTDRAHRCLTYYGLSNASSGRQTFSSLPFGLSDVQWSHGHLNPWHWLHYKGIWSDEVCQLADPLKRKGVIFNQLVRCNWI